MKKKDIIALAVIILSGTIGLIGSRWYPRLGMFIAGSCTSFALMATYGMYLARLAAKRIDKRIKDYIQQQNH